MDRVETADAIGRGLIDDHVVADMDGALGAFKDLVAMEQERAAHERRQRAIATELADRDAADGNLAALALHRRQALVHARAATSHEQTAKLYRRRIAWLG